MDYQKWILEKLIAKYENSTAFISGIFSKRIAIDVNTESKLQELLEEPDEKYSFFAVLDQLKKQRLIQYSWEKYERGNLIEKIWLVPDEASIRTCYRMLKRIPVKDEADELIQLIVSCQQEMEEHTAIWYFLDDVREEMVRKQKISRFFSDDHKLNRNILKCLCEMEKNQEEQMERLFSSKIFDDSKYFERHIKAKVLSILRAVRKRENEDPIEDEELLREKGISRWPEVLEFMGNIKTILTDGTDIDFSTQIYGAYINSGTVRNVEAINVTGIRKVLFIENKANYIWYISNLKRNDELVLFHGGCYSPVKGMWFQQIHSGCKQHGNIKFLHWSDIDIGGFRIYTRLKKNIVPELEPYKMDVETLTAFKEVAIKIQNPGYRARLEQMQSAPEYMGFWDVIQKMLFWDIRLEQEKLIV